MKDYAKTVFVIIGSFVGAGFASGKEIYSFFFRYGQKGILGIVISSCIINAVIYKVFSGCKKRNIKTYSEFCNYIVMNRKILAKVLNDIVNILLLITVFVMVAGFASLLKQEFGINKMLGALIIVVLNYIVSLKSVRGLERISDYLIPIFIIFLIIIMFKNSNYLNLIKYSLEKIGKVNSNKFIMDNWLIKSVLYASYNCVVLIPIIIIMAKNIENKNGSFIVSIWNFCLIVMLSLSIYSLLLIGNESIYKLEMPIIKVVENYGYFYKFIYIILISISIFTTAASSGISFLNNLNCPKNQKRNLLFISFFAILFSNISFGTLVNCLYPAFGMIGLLELGCLFLLI